MTVETQGRRLALLCVACLGHFNAPPRSTTERYQALRHMLKGSVARLLEAPLFTLGLTNDADLTWRRGGNGDNGGVASEPKPSAEEDEELIQWEALLDESETNDRAAPNWSDVGYEPRYRTIKRLSAQDELRFVVLAKAGDRFARQKLTVHYLPLLLAVARRYRHRGLSLSELVNEATFGLVRAIERFDLSRKLRFGTYAKWWMRDAIDQALANQGRLVRLPTHVMRALRGRERANGADAPPVAAHTETELRGARLILADPEHAEHAGIEETTPEALFTEKEQQALLQQGLAALSEREREVLVRRFGLLNEEPRTLMRVADELGVSHERVRQIQNTALGKLKSFMIERCDS